MRRPEQELAEIKSMMERSTRFLSLSGLSGILTGTYALIGAGLAYGWIYYPNSPIGPPSAEYNDSLLHYVLITALIVMVLAITTAWIMSQNKSKKKALTFLSSASKRFAQALFIPVLMGGIFCLALIMRDQIEMLVPATLIFYGIGLVSASHFTLSDIKYLGYCQLILGVISAFLPSFGLILWAIGFGVVHIIYGTMMYYKYER